MSTPERMTSMRRQISLSGTFDVKRVLDPLAEMSGDVADVDLDLSGVTFATPFAQVALAAAVDGWSLARGLRLLCPRDPDCKRYLASSGFFQAMSGVLDLVDDDGFGGLSPSWTAATVLPVTLVQSNAEIPELLASIEARLDSMLGRRDAAWEQGKRPILSTVRELCQNIFDHADFPRGWISAQQYQNRWNGRPFVEIGIADAGRGIRASLETNSASAGSQSDSEAIQRALKGVSRREGEFGGTGYLVLQKATRDLDGSFFLRSGSGAVNQPRNGTARLEDLPVAWPGTFLKVVLTCAG